MATILLLSGPNLNLLGEREPRLRHDDARRAGRDRVARPRPKRGHDVEHVQSNHEGALVDAIHGARGRCAAIVFNPARSRTTRTRSTDALAMFDGVEDRAAPLEPARARGVAPPLGDLAGRRRHHHRASGHGLPPRGRRGAPTLLGGAQHDAITRTARPHRSPRSTSARGSAACRRASPTPQIDALLVTKLANVRYLTGFTGSAALLLVTPRRRACSSPTAATPSSAHEELDAAGVDARDRDRAHRRRAARAARRRGRRPARGSGSRSTRSPGRSRCDYADGVRRRRARARGRARRGAAPGEGRGRDRPHPARVRDRRRRVPVVAADARRAPDRARVRARARVRDARARRERQQLRSDHRVGPERREAAPRAERPRRSSATSSSCATSAASSTGYCSDMTRTVCVGDPGPDARHLYDVVLESQQAGRAAVAVDVACAEVDRASRDVIADAGWADAFSHSTGHGVGLEIHEAPRVASTAGDTLLLNDVVTVEPGVYLPGVGGVRIEDTARRRRDRRRTPHPDPQGSRPVRSREHLDQRPEERHGPQPSRGPGDGRRVPAREAGQGRRVRAHEAEERAHRRRARPHVPRRREGQARGDRQARDAVPLPRGRRLRLHGQRDLRPAPRRGGERRQRGRTT